MLETILLLISFFTIFTIGILFERYILQQADQKKPVDFFNKQKDIKNNTSNISIDSSKVVLDIKKNNVEKHYDELGKKTKTKDNTQSAISKLKNMKGR
jgi:hypothetical protein